MPELPDVATFQNYLHQTSLNKKIKKVEISDSSILKTSKSKINDSAKNSAIKDSYRRGKYLFAKMGSGDHLVFHFGMTGFFDYSKGEVPDYGKVQFFFSDDYHLSYVNKRKLGWVDHCDDIEKYCEKKDLGKDALELSKEEFSNLFRQKKGKTKSALMDQSVMAGIGNVYGDEILYQAGIMPDRSCSSLSKKDWEHLYNVMKRVLEVSIRHKANVEELPKSYLLPNRKEGNDCPRCKGKIATMKINNRTSYYCSSCQK